MTKKTQLDLIVHAWDINIYVKLDKTIREKLYISIIKNYKSFNNFHTYVKLNRKVISAVYMGYFTNILNIMKIMSFLSFDKNYVERHIELFRDSKTGAYNRTYKNLFPIKINPAIIRIVAHTIGDGSIYKDRVWYGQKRGVQFLNALILSLIKPIDCKINYSKSSIKNLKIFYEINIPMVFAKIVAFSFKIKIKDIKSYLFLEKLLALPKECRIQALAAIYVDEGCIRSNAIRMGDPKVIKTIAKIIDSLNYKRSEVTYRLWTGMCFGKYHETDVYGVSLWNEGILGFHKDIKNCIRKYESICFGLWHKHNDFEEKIKSINISTIEARKEADHLRIVVLEILNKRRVIVLGKLAKELKINKDRMYYLLKSLMVVNKIKRLKYGEYALTH